MISQNISNRELWDVYTKTKSVESRNALVMTHSDMVSKIAKRIVSHINSYNYIEDAVDEGLLALIEAVEKFDVTRGVKFETYATIRIKGAIIDYIRKQDCFPRRIRQQASVLSDAFNRLTMEYGRYPTQQELAEKLGIEVSKLEKMQSEVDTINIFSFEELIFKISNGAIYDESLISKEDVADQRIESEELSKVLASAIDELNDVEKKIIHYQYQQQLKRKEISYIMNIGVSRVSQIHTVALSKLRQKLEKYIDM